MEDDSSDGGDEEGGGYPFYGGLPPHQAHSRTSRAAAINALRRAEADRTRVLDYIRACGPAGATSDEVQAALSLSHQTGSARVAECLQGGLLVETGTTRLTRRGCAAEVLVIAPPGTPPKPKTSRRRRRGGGGEGGGAVDIEQLRADLVAAWPKAKAVIEPPRRRFRLITKNGRTMLV